MDAPRISSTPAASSISFGPPAKTFKATKSSADAKRSFIPSNSVSIFRSKNPGSSFRMSPIRFTLFRSPSRIRMTNPIGSPHVPVPEFHFPALIPEQSDQLFRVDLGIPHGNEGVRIHACPYPPMVRHSQGADGTPSHARLIHHLTDLGQQLRRTGCRLGLRHFQVSRRSSGFSCPHRRLP